MRVHIIYEKKDHYVRKKNTKEAEYVWIVEGDYVRKKVENFIMIN